MIFFKTNSFYHPYFTRNSEDLTHERRNTTRAGFVLRNIGVSVWNDLPESVRAAVSLASFKRMVKFHFLKRREV